MLILTLVLLIVLFIVLKTKEKQDTVIFQKNNKDRFDNIVFPYYERFFRSAILTCADEFKICRLLGTDTNYYRVASAAYKFTPYFAAMYFKVQCNRLGDDEELNAKYSKKLSEFAEFDICKKYQESCHGIFPRKNFVRTKLKKMTENELVIGFVIPRDCILDFDGNTIF